MKSVRILVMVLLLALVAAACGDDDSGLLGDAPTAGTEAENPFGGGGDGGGGDATTETFPSTVGNIPGLSGECEAIANLSLAMVTAFTGGANAIDPGIVASLPGDMQADGAIIVNALQQWADGLAAAGIDMSNPAALGAMTEEQIATFETMSDTIFTDEVNDAFDRLADSAEANCTVPTG